MITVGALDLLLDDDLAFARCRMRDGVDVELHVHLGLFDATWRALGSAD